MNYKSQESYLKDERIVLTLDAGGTNLVFSAIQGAREIVTPVTLPCIPNDLNLVLQNIEDGFRGIKRQIRSDVYAISFAFPGPADYKLGIIGDLPNLPAFRGGVALGPFLEYKFDLPVFINNDANLYALGEYVFGFLPWVNKIIEEKGGHKRYNNLVGITLGTGFGCGIICKGQLNTGDNSNGGELWLMRNKLFPELCTDASVGKDKIRRFYAEYANVRLSEVPDSQVLFRIAKAEVKGKREAAQKAFSTMGEIIGDAIANVSILVDGLVVIGGGLCGAQEFFMPAVMKELNGTICHVDKTEFPRIAQKAYFLKEEESINEFIAGKQKTLMIPFSNKSVTYDALPRIGVGITQLGASKAINLGAYVFALSDQ